MGRQFFKELLSLFPFGKQDTIHFLRLRGSSPFSKLVLMVLLIICFRYGQKTLKNLAGKPSIPGADFTKGLKPGFRLKFKTLVLNSVKNGLSQWA